MSNGTFIRISEFLYALKMVKEASGRLTMNDIKELEKLVEHMEEMGERDE